MLDVECGAPENITNGKANLATNATYYGAAVLYECNVNFKLNGVSRRLCTEHGNWSHETPECVEVVCDMPNINENLIVEAGTRAVGSVATFKCAKGRIMVGNDTRVCQKNGKWAGKNPTCRREYTKIIIPWRFEMDWLSGFLVPIFSCRLRTSTSNREWTSNCGQRLYPVRWLRGVPLYTELQPDRAIPAQVHRRRGLEWQAAPMRIGYRWGPRELRPEHWRGHWGDYHCGVAGCVRFYISLPQQSPTCQEYWKRAGSRDEGRAKCCRHVVLYPGGQQSDAHG